MERKIKHPWDVDKQEAIRIQRDLKKFVKLKNSFDKIERIAGIDCSYKEENIKAGYVVCEYKTLKVIETFTFQTEVNFPYIPSFLSFREGPAIYRLLEKIKEPPDVIILNGHGIAHPLNMGLATHIGVIFDIPTIGCARGILYGNYTEPPSFSLSSTFIKDYEGEIIGHTLRTLTGSLIFISPGNKIDLRTTLSTVINTLTEQHPLPYPLYLANLHSAF